MPKRKSRTRKRRGSGNPLEVFKTSVISNVAPWLQSQFCVGMMAQLSRKGIVINKIPGAGKTTTCSDLIEQSGHLGSKQFKGYPNLAGKSIELKGSEGGHNQMWAYKLGEYAANRLSTTAPVYGSSANEFGLLAAGKHGKPERKKAMQEGDLGDSAKIWNYFADHADFIKQSGNEPIINQGGKTADADFFSGFWGGFSMSECVDGNGDTICNAIGVDCSDGSNFADPACQGGRRKRRRKKSRRKSRKKSRKSRRKKRRSRRRRRRR